MPDIADAARLVVTRPCRPPTPIGELQERVRSRRRRRRAVSAVAGAVLIAAAGSGATAALTRAASRPVAVASGGRAAAPAFKRVVYGRASIAVPDDWTVVAGGPAICPVRREVLLGDLPMPPCELGDLGPVSFIRVAPGADFPPGAATILINGHPGHRWSVPSYQSASFTDLDVTITVFHPSGDFAATVFQSVESSSR